MDIKYKIGQVVKFKDGSEGKVITICGRANSDLRPPYHQKGQPVVIGIKGYKGARRIIPMNWNIHYDNEIHETEVDAVVE